MKTKQPAPEPEKGNARKRVFRFYDSEYDRWMTFAKAKKIKLTALIRKAMEAYISG